MRKYLSGFLVLILFFITIQILNAATIKAGTSCTKLGQNQIIAGYKFTCIKSGKKLVWDKGVAVNKSNPTASQIPLEPSWKASPEPLDNCRIKDFRTTQNIGQNLHIAYPNTGSLFPSSGELNVALIPIDFPDVPGKGKPSDFINVEIIQMNKWIKQFSNDNLKLNWQFHDSWIRTTKSSENYAALHPGFEANPLHGAVKVNFRPAGDVAADFLGFANQYYDYKNLSFVFFIFPKEVINIYAGMSAATQVHSPQGDLYLGTISSGAYTYSKNLPIWSSFLHEMMHYIGLAGHAPNDGSPFGLMTGQGGLSLVLYTWEQIILDWQLPNEIYCVSKENLQNATIPLSAVEVDRTIGTKSIVIKLSDHEVLVIEFRKYGYWAKGWKGFNGFPKDLSGLVVYKVDTSVDINRVPDSSGFAFFEKIGNGKNGTLYQDYGIPFDLNSLIKMGQTMNAEGFAITLKNQSGDYGEVLVRKL